MTTYRLLHKARVFGKTAWREVDTFATLAEAQQVGKDLKAAQGLATKIEKVAGWTPDRDPLDELDNLGESPDF